MIAVVISNIFNLCLKSFKIRIRFRDGIESDAEPRTRFVFEINIVATALPLRTQIKILFCIRMNVVVMGGILSRILELTKLIESGIESGTHFVFEINTVAVGRKLPRTQLVGLYLRF